MGRTRKHTGRRETIKRKVPVDALYAEKQTTLQSSATIDKIEVIIALKEEIREENQQAAEEVTDHVNI